MKPTIGAFKITLYLYKKWLSSQSNNNQRTHLSGKLLYALVESNRPYLLITACNNNINMILEKVSSYQQYCAADNTNTQQDVTDDEVAGKKYRELLCFYFF